MMATRPSINPRASIKRPGMVGDHYDIRSYLRNK